MNKNELKAEFIRKGIKFKTIADQLGVKAPAISAVISGNKRNPRIRAALAKALGRPVEELFSDLDRRTGPSDRRVGPSDRRSKSGKK